MQNGNYRKQSAKIILCLILIFSTFYYSYACTCPLGDIPPCRAFEKADAVFVGKLLKMSELTVSQEGSPIKVVSFEVKRVAKGKIGKNVEVRIPVGDCGFSMKNNETYFIYANMNSSENMLETDRCGRFREISEAKYDLEFIDSLKAQIPVQAIVGNIEGLDETDLQLVTITVKNKDITETYRPESNGTFDIKTKETGLFTITISFPFEAEIQSLANPQSPEKEMSESETLVKYYVSLSNYKCDYRLLIVKKKKKNDLSLNRFLPNLFHDARRKLFINKFS